MKKITSLFIVLVLLMNIVGCTKDVDNTTNNNEEVTSESTLQDGTYEGIGEGKDGDMIVQVTIKEGKVTDIQVVEHNETEGISDAAIKEIVSQVIEQNNLDVDAVAGATLTSEGLIEAIKSALIEAGATEEQLAKGSGTTEDTSEEVVTEETYDVVIIGGGGAGLSAAIEAREAGANVVLLEKMPFVGGNTLISGGEMAAVDNWVQEKLGIEDSIERHIEDTLKGGDYKNDEALVKTLVENALPTAQWLKEDISVEFEEDHLYQFGGHTAKRSLIPKGATGSELITKLNAKAEELGVEIKLQTKAVDLIEEDGTIVGVKAENKNGDVITFNANNGVVIATGGFGANIDMRKKYNPELDERYLTTNNVGATGDGAGLAQSVGGELIQMEYIQTYPACNPNTGIISYVADTRFDGAVLVNIEGKRFVEELDRRDVISTAIVSQSDQFGYLIWDNTIAEKSQMASHQHEYDDLVESGLLHKAETLEEAAEFFGINVEEFLATIERYNGFANNGKDEDFNRKGDMTPIAEAPFYIQKVSPSVHHTMGGIRINTEAQVLTADGEVIPGLYAAGECVGGVHGTNRLGSNAIADIMVFGRIAGQNAAQEQ